MAYDEKLAARVREIISLKHKNTEEKKIFSGLCFMVNDKMCVGVQAEKMMVRLNPEVFEEAIQKEGCVPMVMKGKMMRGFVFVDTTQLATKKKLAYWLNLALEYNKIAKASPKKKKK